jgi:hypothetical protein
MERPTDAKEKSKRSLLSMDTVPQSKHGTKYKAWDYRMSFWYFWRIRFLNSAGFVLPGQLPQMARAI